MFALPGQDDLLMIVRRVEALGLLLDTEDGKNLLAGYRRAANILRAEEKKDGAGASSPTDTIPPSLVLPAEKDLADVLAAAGAAARERVGREDFEGAMRALATLRAPVDAFFLDVTVNADDPALRLNRLRLARRIARGDARGRGFLQGRRVGEAEDPPRRPHRAAQGRSFKKPLASALNGGGAPPGADRKEAWR